jgi:transmembrane sensor
MTKPPRPEPAGAFDFWDALARYLAGESPPEEAERVRRWLAEDPARAELVATLDRTLDRLAYTAPPELDVEQALQRVTRRMSEPEVRSLRERRAATRRATGWAGMGLRVAAAIALLVSGVLLWRAIAGRDAVVTARAQTFASPAGRLDTLQLADGTTIVLAPLSRLVVPGGYGVSARMVELTGEALFEVIHDEDRPFAVRAGDAMIRDLGTAFSVRGEAGEDVSVVVTSGSVVLHAANASPDSGAVLRARDRGVLGRDGRVSVQRDVTVEPALAWTRRQLVFEDAPLSRVRSELRRWYGLELMPDSALESRRLTATFQNETVDEVLQILGLALGVRIERRGDSAFVQTSTVAR